VSTSLFFTMHFQDTVCFGVNFLHFLVRNYTAGEYATIRLVDKNMQQFLRTLRRLYAIQCERVS